MSFFSKTFGGLTASYYIRHFLFGLIIALLFGGSLYLSQIQTTRPLDVIQLSIATVYLSLSQFLYPYSRFVYESVVGYILGNNVFFMNTSSFIYLKFITMFICWVLAIIIAPLGLIYLYFYHSKQEKQALAESKQQS